MTPPEKILVRGVKLRVIDLAQSKNEETEPYLAANYTKEDIGISSGKQIVVPSISSLTKIFAKHFNTLDKLYRRISLIKQAYMKQVEIEGCWEHIEQVLTILDQGSKYLKLQDSFD